MSRPQTSTSARPRRLALALAAALGGAALAVPAATAEPIHQTQGPFGGFLGLNGFDVFVDQSVAARFIPPTQHTLDKVSIWFMSNDFDGTTPQSVTVTLRTDVNPGNDFDSIPSETILETWTMDLPVVGWDPQLVDFNSATHVTLNANQKYWVVAESTLPPFVDPVWCFASEGTGFTATTDGPGTPWESGDGGTVAFEVHATPTAPACPADFNGENGVDLLDIFAFLNHWFGGCTGAGVPSASCTKSADFNRQNGVDLLDIFAFLNAWFAGPCT